MTPYNVVHNQMCCLRTTIKGISLHPRKTVTINFSANKLIFGKDSLDVYTALFIYYFAFYFIFFLFILILGLKLYKHILDIQMGTNCSPFVVLYCHERYHMLSLSDNNQVMLLKFYYSTLRYVDDLLNIGPFPFNYYVMFIFVMLVVSVPCRLGMG